MRLPVVARGVVASGSVVSTDEIAPPVAEEDDEDKDEDNAIGEFALNFFSAGSESSSSETFLLAMSCGKDRGLLTGEGIKGPS